MTMIAPSTLRQNFDNYSRIVGAHVVNDALVVTFADGITVSVTITAFENAFVRHQQLDWSGVRPALHEILVPSVTGEDVGIPWDSIRAVSDPNFEQLWSEMKRDAANRLGEGIRSLRFARAMSREELALRSGMPASQVQQFENGELPADIDVAEQLLSAMGHSLDDLAKGAKEPGE